ncbi:integrin alpha-V-like isoform X2 [Macrobrachium nipponense]|uniref:integrin alpha-V-like isoform X2 n=1 Tax=Macrobrachium nipponense TaxID=159736 RepID=UPI0030C84478
MVMIVTVLVLGMSLLQRALTFNIDVQFSTSVTGPSGSNFGFSVAMWWMDGMSRLAVGAPGYSVSGGNSQQRHPIQEGAVFLCDFTDEMSYESCSLLPRNFDMTDAQDKTRDLVEFGFGSTVVAGGRNNTSLLVCAPQSYNVFKRGQLHSYKTVGECVLLDSSSSSGVRIKPNVGGQEYIDDFVYCGFSAAFSKDNTAIFVSCPSISLESSKFKIITYNITTREVLQYDLTDICEGNYYKGWHVAPGSHGDGIVASCIGTGQVDAKVIKTAGSPHSSQLLEVMGLTVGERAGFSLETCDIDGDGEDEVIVGAPFGRVSREYANSLWMETGKIVVLGKKGKHSTYDGPQEFSRFGASVACLGDLNKDGYQDIAVGAPQQANGGAVFIYSGSKEGLKPQPSQVIHGADVKPHMVGFGYSLASGHDLDGNGYPDLLVGSPQSNAVVSLRTAPVIKIGVHSFRFSEEQVDLQRPDHTLHLIVEVDCRSEHNFVVEMELILNLDVSQRWGKRILFEENSQASLERRVELENVGINHFSFPVYIEISSAEDVVDVSYSDLKMTLAEVRPSSEETMMPVLEDLENPGTQWKDLARTTSVRLSCSSNITSCIATTNIGIETKTQRMPFDVGLRDVELTIDITVENATAFDPTLTLTTPQGLALRRAYFTNSFTDLSCQSDGSCLASSEACLPVQVCTSSRTKLRPADKESIALLFKQKRDEVISFTNNHPNPQMNFSVTVGSVNEDFDESDNTLSLTFLPQVSPDFYILGLSVPETLSIEASSSKDADGVDMTRVQDVFLANDHINKSDLGPTVKHSYDLTESGDIPLEEIQVDIYWPIRNGTDNRTFSFLKTSPKVFPSAAGLCQYNGTFWDHSSFLDDNSFVYAIFRCSLRPTAQNGKLILTTEAVLVKSFFLKAPSSVSLRSQITGSIARPTSWRFNPSLDQQESKEVIRTLTVLTKVSVILERGQLPPPWVILLSVISGLALLGVLAYGMYKVGFFKRRLVPRFHKHEEAVATNNEDSISNGN